MRHVGHRLVHWDATGKTELYTDWGHLRRYWRCSSGIFLVGSSDHHCESALCKIFNIWWCCGTRQIDRNLTISLGIRNWVNLVNRSNLYGGFVSPVLYGLELTLFQSEMSIRHAERGPEVAIQCVYLINGGEYPTSPLQGKEKWIVNRSF